MKTLFRSALNLIWPRACVGCGENLDPDSPEFCWTCFRSIEPVSEPFCQTCGMPVPGETFVNYECQSCCETSVHFDCARSAARFDGVMRHAIHNFKYRQSLWLDEALGDYLCSAAEAYLPVSELTSIVPVPLFSRRYRERGYNQSQLLADVLGARLDLPVLKALKRTRATPSQTNLSVEERRKNVRNAFATYPIDPAQAKTVCLVDDVMTSGATVNECARVLKKNGTETVYVLTVARG